MGWPFAAFARDFVLVAVAMSVTVSAAVATTIHWNPVNGHGVNRDGPVDWVATVAVTMAAVTATVAIRIAETASSAAVCEVVIPVAERDRKAAGRTAVMAMVSLRR
jgi:hypothetical protein